MLAAPAKARFVQPDLVWGKPWFKISNSKVKNDNVQVKVNAWMLLDDRDIEHYFNVRAYEKLSNGKEVELAFEAYKVSNKAVYIDVPVGKFSAKQKVVHFDLYNANHHLVGVYSTILKAK